MERKVIVLLSEYFVSLYWFGYRLSTVYRSLGKLEEKWRTWKELVERCSNGLTPRNKRRWENMLCIAAGSSHTLLNYLRLKTPPPPSLPLFLLAWRSFHFNFCLLVHNSAVLLTRIFANLSKTFLFSLPQCVKPGNVIFFYLNNRFENLLVRKC